ncbi:MAG: YdeI/OmpD-associated family protein [Longimicrobiales bacterium]
MTDPFRRFEAVVEAGARGGALVVVPLDVEAAWGARRIPVRAIFDDRVDYRGTVVFMGGRPILGVTRAVRDALGKDVGDTVRVRMVRDDAPRTVELPAELAAALASDPDLAERFEALAYTHRKEFARWVGGARRPETRERRLRTTLDMLADGTTLS